MSRAKSRTRAAGPGAAKPAKVAIARLRKLAAALERDDVPDGVPEEVQAVSEQLADLGDPARATAAAVAVLAHTPRGSAVARAYLGVIASEGDGPLAAANVVARYCATMKRGRKLMRPAFLATWRRADDLAAVDAAWKNLARIALDDPALLAVAAETARRLGDPGSLAAHTAALERALRLAPLLAELSGGPAARARATRQLAALPAEDRRHIHARVIDHPRSYDKALALASVIALVDDPRAPDMALAAAVFELRRHGKDPLVAVWRPRVAAGDAALMVRLLALFEWTGLWATDEHPFEPYIEALIPVGSEADVFAQVESGLASDNAVVREAILHRWLGDKAGFAAFSDAQADNLMRSAIAIAEAGTDTSDQRAAHRVVSYAGDGRAGVHRALIDGIRHASKGKAAELRGDLYRGLQRIDHPAVVAFLVERLFVERTAYAALMDAVAARLDADFHRAALAALAERRADPGAAHAATIYADTLIEKRRSARLLGDVAHAVLTWQPGATDDKRRLRYVFEQATLAAITTRQPRDARAFLARARSFDVTPYSDYQVVDRDRKTPAAFVEAVGKRLIAALEVGAIDKEIAVARETADAARAEARPVPVDDAELGALAGCTVSRRFFDDRDHHEVWFFDELGDLHVYDGYAVALPPFQVTGTGERGIADGPRGMAAFLSGRSQLDERVVLYDTARRERAREVLRFAERVLVLDGTARDKAGELAVTAIGLRFADPAAARAAVARFAAHPPAGTQRVDPFQIAGGQTIHRTYQLPTPNASNGQGQARLGVAGGRIAGTLGADCPPLEQTHATADAASAALQAWEGRVLARGGRIVKTALD